jgi:hypothetical protein
LEHIRILLFKKLLLLTRIKSCEIRRKEEKSKIYVFNTYNAHMLVSVYYKTLCTCENEMMYDEAGNREEENVLKLQLGFYDN